MIRVQNNLDRALNLRESIQQYERIVNGVTAFKMGCDEYGLSDVEGQKLLDMLEIVIVEEGSDDLADYKKHRDYNEGA